MTEADFIRTETNLGMIPPTEYRSVMTTLANELRQLTLEFRGSCDDECLVYLDADRVLVNNLGERGDSGPIPDWEQTHFPVEDNTSGDYFCLRLDKTPGVWVIGSDCEEGQVAETLEQYVQTQRYHARFKMRSWEESFLSTGCLEHWPFANLSSGWLGADCRSRFYLS